MRGDESLPALRTDKAQNDLAEILKWLDEHNPSAAVRFADAVDERCKQLGQFPKMGRSRDELSPGLRSIVVDRYVEFYRVTTDAVQVVRVLEGRRDVETTIRSEE